MRFSIMKRPWYSIVAIALYFFAPSISVTFAQTALILRPNVLYGGLTNSLIGLVTLPGVPEEVRERSARQLYALCFQYWMVTENQQREGVQLQKNLMKALYGFCRKYIDPTDPMTIDQYYDADGFLTKLGKMAVELEPIQNGEQLFGTKTQYHEFASKFNEWLKQKGIGDNQHSGTNREQHAS